MFAAAHGNDSAAAVPQVPGVSGGSRSGGGCGVVGADVADADAGDADAESGADADGRDDAGAAAVGGAGAAHRPHALAIGVRFAGVATPSLGRGRRSAQGPALGPPQKCKSLKSQ